MTERLYTLEEAKLENNRQECERMGHDYRIILAIGHNKPQLILCDRCGLSWGIDDPTAGPS